MQESLKAEMKSKFALQSAMEVVEADLEVAHANVDRLEQMCSDAAATTQAELTKQLEANAALQEQYEEAQQQISSLELQQVALEESCKDHKQQVGHLQYICFSISLVPPILGTSVHSHTVVFDAAALALRSAGSLQVECLKASVEDLRRDKDELQDQLAASTAAGDYRDDDSAEGDEGEFCIVGAWRGTTSETQPEEHFALPAANTGRQQNCYCHMCLLKHPFNYNRSHSYMFIREEKSGKYCVHGNSRILWVPCGFSEAVIA